MAFIFTCGTHTFESLLAGYENITVQCQNCGNWSGKVVKRWEWFTFCFVPLIPFSLKPWHAVGCHICHFKQDIKYRPDVQQQMDGGGGAPGAPPKQQEGQIPLQNQPPQGWGQPGQGGAQTQYQPPAGQVPQYK
ncbi:unnamed protein product [Zymoseptoria tritici ST99CH_1A5]|uniref:Zinc-ribbon 15 domain-containing protein n=4 Tax=Zymoseptoria tritici TaxID=1047171 RepID=F9X891_ZYMTI|nr:uncharacterized protein MYCGRDRAFT_104074 [Zymoseptoria tritici IPO323]SMQ49720.1 unnamed protein product [Zymoseptoria tritici ST99CH_3D7]SMR50705.1 unnamed protein product [Zymoseptoria tritici ST99CH_1E4]SMR51647.1 unnamed protein product [Zymoseptoria tritici ST99CH_3D1]SMY23410.1 unnamed protein product [Zymoseptoria tritici ST99CH_1A5]EGP88491.1 hypothetical protein MYCGRDRAFT_104074 [Zymoseptoria tritici IPO323]